MTGPNAFSTAVVRAGPTGRLIVEVPLGPPNPYQQDTPQAQAAGSAVYTTPIVAQNTLFITSRNYLFAITPSTQVAASK